MFLRIARWLIVIILFLIPGLIIPQASSEETAEDKACSSKLFGTVSAKTCEEVCPKASAKCFKTHEYPSETGGEKLECYTCARDQQCSEIGAIDWWGCFACDANPATECIKAGFTPPFGGGPFGGKTWSGVQCYKCVPRPDRCSDVFPGTSWLASCQATCQGPNKDCVFVGIHEGNDCYKCIEAKGETCADLGLLDKTGCQNCEKDPQKACIIGGMTIDFKLCYQCINRIQLPPPPPKGCKELGLADNCDACLKQGMGCLPTQAPNGQACYECIPRTQNYCPPPSLNKWECPICEERGGQCIGKTRTKDDPDCYDCYYNNREEISACARREMWDSCTPNPCFENQTCKMIIVEPPDFQCAQCEDIPGYHEDQKCEEYNKYTTCAPCYEKKHGCRKVHVPEINEWCAECYDPYAAACVSQDDQALYKSAETQGVKTEVAMVLKQNCSDCIGETTDQAQVILEVSILSRGNGEGGRDWIPEKPVLQVGNQTIKPARQERYYVSRESIGQKAAGPIFAAIGALYKDVGEQAANSEGQVCPVTGQKLEGGSGEEKSKLAQGIDRAGMAAGLGLIASQAKGQITGTRACFNLTQVEDLLAQGQTMALKGVVENESKQKKVFLRDIPIVGFLFRQKSADSEKKNLTIMVTPQVINDSGGE